MHLLFSSISRLFCFLWPSFCFIYMYNQQSPFGTEIIMLGYLSMNVMCSKQQTVSESIAQ